MIVPDLILEAFPFEPPEGETMLDRFYTLSPLSRLVLTARYLNKLSVQETAKFLHIKASLVKWICRESIGELKKGAG